MEQPPTPSNSTTPPNTPDLPKPPIWERQTPTTPPINIPVAPTSPLSEPTAPAPAAPYRPIVPDVTVEQPAATPTTPVQSTPMQPTPAQPPQARPAPVASVPVQPTSTTPPGAPAPGPSFADRSYLAVPASGAGSAERPRWPTEPPTVGYQPNPAPPQSEKRLARRLGLGLLVLLLAAGVAAAAFFVGRGFGSSETTTDVPVAAPTTPATAVPEATAEATPPPTAAPSPVPPVNDSAQAAPAPILPLDGAEEPVAAVAAAVAPTVVLIQHELGQGSGIVYDASGLILTNAHVVGQFTEVQVTLASGVRVPGVVLGADPLTDVAVVQIDTDSEFGVATLAPESSVQVGQLAVAIGSPFGLEQTVTSGVVSAIGRVLLNPTETGQDSIVAMIQTDAPINPGNSGGALADRQGRVIGMNTSIRTDGSGGNIGVGFAIPSDTAKLIADRIIAGEPLEQGFLGIGGGTPLIGTPGVVVSEVTPGSGAEAAGLLPGDLIIGFNEQEIKSMTDLAAAVRLQAPDALVLITFLRNDETLQLEVRLTTFEAN